MSKTVDWTTCTVKDVVERHFCGPSPDCEERQIFAPEEWGVLKTTAITWTGWDEKAHKVLPRAFWGQAKIEVHAGDVLVTKAGPRNRVGVVCHVPSTRSQLVVSGKMIGLRPISEAVNASFLAGFLATQESQKYIHDRTTGMAESQVNFANEVLLDTPLRIPPIQEQDLIAKVLDTLDTTISETETIIEKLKVVKLGLLQDLLTRGIDANGELRPPQSVAPQLYKESPLGWIPKEWEALQMRDITTLITSGSRGWATYYVETGALFLRSQNVRMGYLDFSDRQHVSPPNGGEGLRTKLNSRDLLITITGNGVGNVAYVPESWDELAFVSQHVGLIRFSEPQFSLLAMHYLVEGAPGNQQIINAQYGQSKPGLNLENLRNLCVPAPSEDERVAITERIACAYERIDIEGRFSAQLRELKQGLMNDLLTGRVRVTSLLEEGAA